MDLVTIENLNQIESRLSVFSLDKLVSISRRIFKSLFLPLQSALVPSMASIACTLAFNKPE
ncbi:hypothetical protein BpHYR1_016757 [Brachionus plicatilis]|uniref:Uncharacterized protein n=1 Tax=Brachionus plicatilis TaxID=10195 RepID=A0A3M7Q213_BRAPC|nr:hypothetical protein BpHYR1_016757 [Brachionus plicatilis]